VKNSAVKDKPEVYDFVKFTIENAADLSEDVGYVRLPDEEYEKGLETLEGLK
jgi:phosphate transport system substrate-binding protein